MNIQKQIEVMQGFADGKRVELRNLGTTTDWFVTSNPNWNWEECEYRLVPEVKPEDWRPKLILDRGDSKRCLYLKFHDWLFQLSDELNEGWDPDWEDNSEKFCLEKRNAYGFVITGYTALNSFASVFKDKQTAEKALEIVKTWDWYWSKQ